MIRKDKFITWLRESGAEILAPTNPYEVVRGVRSRPAQPSSIQSFNNSATQATLRDQFALLAMSAVMAGLKFTPKDSQEIGETIYKIADAIMDERGE